MKRIFSLLFAIIICLCGNKLLAQNDAGEKAWVAYKTPGDIHKILASDEGEWNVEISTWMAPGSDPVKSAGSCVNKMILQGRYLESHYTGQMMGMTFEGKGIIGYDNAKKIFVSSWVDNFGTGMMYMEGTWDNTANAMISKGKSLDPTTGKDMEVKEVYKILDNKSRLMEMYIKLPDESDFKTMEIKYARK